MLEKRLSPKKKLTLKNYCTLGTMELLLRLARGTSSVYGLQEFCDFVRIKYPPTSLLWKNFIFILKWGTYVSILCTYICTYQQFQRAHPLINWLGLHFLRVQCVTSRTVSWPFLLHLLDIESLKGMNDLSYSFLDFSLFSFDCCHIYRWSIRLDDKSTPSSYYHLYFFVRLDDRHIPSDSRVRYSFSIR